MKIEKTNVTKITITDVPKLDPIAVYLEDFGEGRGKATITCYNDSWSYYWGAMGENSIKKFLCMCDTPYLAGKFDYNTSSTVTDNGKIVEEAKRFIREKRRDDWFSKEMARELYLNAENLSDLDVNSSDYADQMYEIFGDEWWDNLPTSPNPDYLYLCRVIDAVKEALKGE